MKILPEGWRFSYSNRVGLTLRAWAKAYLAPSRIFIGLWYHKDYVNTQITTRIITTQGSFINFESEENVIEMKDLRKVLTGLVSVFYLVIAASTTEAQEKVGPRTYQYGSFGSALENVVVLNFEIDDPKGENRALKAFRKRGVETYSWNSLFMPGRSYSNADKLRILERNNIETLIRVKRTSPTAAVGNIRGNVGRGTSMFVSNQGHATVTIDFEVYTKEDDFEEPICLIKSSAVYETEIGSAERDRIAKIVNRILRVSLK